MSPQESEKDYPYVGPLTSVCDVDLTEGKVTVKNYGQVQPRDVGQLKSAIATGPVSVTIEADKSVF